MLKPEDINYFKYGKNENIKFWKNLAQNQILEIKKLDFGCGHGSLALEIASLGAQKVIGIDLNIDLINFAKNNLNQNFLN